VLQALPDGLTEETIRTARKIRFTPAMQNGRPISVSGMLEFAFNLYGSFPNPTCNAPALESSTGAFLLGSFTL
jgi:Gram-negative bacterial TonB protein C-terminal